jgi:hypothetical protein
MGAWPPQEALKSRMRTTPTNALRCMSTPPSCRYGRCLRTPIDELERKSDPTLRDCDSMAADGSETVAVYS